jgi:DNA-binding CsgD family transcriptional regulator/outer membrane lipoprotein-sorting protein
VTTDTASDFREAAKHERELNGRQRDILRLIEAGHTNREIGDMLGLSVDGAKWNVSEILTKLGLESREQAAEYWRWRHGSVWSRVRGWLGAPLLRITGAGAAAVLAVGVVAGLFSQDEAAGADEPGRPFYLEADVRLVRNPGVRGPFIPLTPDLRRLPEPAESEGVLRVWWRDEQHFRWEYERRTPADQTGTDVAVADGEFQWSHRAGEESYLKIDLVSIPDNQRILPIVGALSSRANASTVDDLVAFLGEGRVANGWVNRLSDKTYLGRTVAIIESGPIGCGEHGAFMPDAPPDDCWGSGQTWLDPKTMLVLKLVATGEDGRSIESLEASVTRLEYDTEVPESELVFEPPPGTTVEDLSRAPDEPGPEPPPGFLRLGFVPRGYRSDGTGGGGGSETATVWQHFLSPQDARLVFTQEKADLPGHLRQGDERTVAGVTAFAATLDGGSRRLAFERDGLAVVLEAEALSFDELVALAESLELVP